MVVEVLKGGELAHGNAFGLSGESGITVLEALAA
jgi:hypothetical protein